MKIQIMSDLHLECCGDLSADVAYLFRGPAEKADALVVAGDFTTSHLIPAHAWAYFTRKLLKKRQALFVPGNHDYYNGSFDSTRQQFSKMGEHVRVLDNSIATIKGQRILGSTLWFRDNPLNALYRKNLADFEWIHRFEAGVYEENLAAIKFLQENLREGDVVVTHHAPSEMSVSAGFIGSQLNRFFVCDLSELILDRKPALWVHGHMHGSHDYKLGDTRVICNPRGYPGYDLNRDFDPNLVVEI